MSDHPTAQALLAGPLGTWLEEQAAVRAEAKRRSSDRLFWALMIILPALAIFFILAPVEWDGKFSLALLALAIAYAWSQGPTRQAIKAVKAGSTLRWRRPWA